MNEREQIDAFLAGDAFAVVGASRDRAKYGNKVLRAYLQNGRAVHAVNPSADEVEGDRCYARLADLPVRVDAVLAATAPDATLEVVRECAELGISRLWMHRSFGQGSVSDEAAALCVAKGIQVIPGGCPMMFAAPVDLGHRCMRWLLWLTGGLPKAA